MKNQTEFLFAHWAVSKLKELRGAKWRALVERVEKLPEDDPDALAFDLTMVRINGCANCNLHRYRDRGGCAQCSRFVLTTLSKESEASLLARYHVAQKEISNWTRSVMLEKKVA